MAKRNYSLSWTVGEGLAARGGKQQHAVWSDILPKLEDIKMTSGSVTLHAADPSNRRTLQVQANGDAYLLMLGEEDDADYHVRTYTNVDSDSEVWCVAIGGNAWSPRMVCRDFDIVLRSFEQFFTTGDVSRDVLD